MERKKIFVGYGFNDRDKAIAELVRRTVVAFGFEFVDGRELEGQELGDAIRNGITASFGLLALTTRREPLPGENRFKSHDWVTAELQFAQSTYSHTRVVEIREVGVVWEGALHGNRGYINLESGDLSKCIVDLAEVLGRWGNEAAQTLKLRVAPEKVSEDLFVASEGDGTITCSYRLVTSDKPVPARLEVGAGGLFIDLGSGPIGDSVIVRVEHKPREGKPRAWTSSGLVKPSEQTVKFTAVR